MKFLPVIIAVCLTISLSSCKKEVPALIKPAQSLKAVSDDCTMLRFAKQIQGAGIKSVKSVVDPEYGFIYIAGTITDHATVDLDPGPGEYIVTGWSGFIVRLSASGNFSWAVRGVDNVVGFDMAIGTHSLYIACQLGTGKLVTSSIRQASGQIEWSKSVDIFATVGQVRIAVDRGYDVYTSSIATSSYDLDPGPEVFKAPGAGTYRFVQKLDGRNGNFITAVASADIKAAKQLATDRSGNIYVLYLGNSNSNNCYLAKHNSKGARLYSKLINTAIPPTEGLLPSPSMSLDDEGNAYVHHATSLSRIDPAGTIKWKVDLGTDEAVKIVTDKAGNTYLTNGSGNGERPATRLVKISKLGKLLYNKSLFDYTSHGDGSGVKHVRIAGLHIFDTLGLIITGDFTETVNFDPQGENGILTANANNIPDIFAVSINTCD